MAFEADWQETWYNYFHQFVTMVVHGFKNISIQAYKSITNFNITKVEKKFLEPIFFFYSQFSTFSANLTIFTTNSLGYINRGFSSIWRIEIKPGRREPNSESIHSLQLIFSFIFFTTNPQIYSRMLSVKPSSSSVWNAFISTSSKEKQ